MSCPTCGNERRPYCNNCNPDAFVERQTDFTDREMMESTIARLTAERDELLQSRNAERNRADRAEGERDDFIRQLAEAVAEQGRLQTQLRDANAAGVVLAAEVYDFAAALAYDTGQDVLTHVSEDVKSNPLALAWVRQAQEASNG